MTLSARRLLVVALVAATVVLMAGGAHGIGCKDMDGADVDWFLAFKNPKNVGDDGRQKEGSAFVYMDPTSDMGDSGKSLKDKKQALGYTLAPLYTKPIKDDVSFLLYNDEGPFTQGPPYLKENIGKKSSSGAHMKGVIVYNKDGGFWLVHSTPRWPNLPSQDYDFGDYALDYGQSYLCLTLDAENVQKALQQIHLAHPLIHASANPGGDEKLQAIIDEKKQKASDEKALDMTTVGGHAVTAIYKNVPWGDEKFYKDAVYSHYKIPLNVETWMRGAREPDICPAIKNVAHVNLGFGEFKESKDHSKYAVSQDDKTPLVCVGGINRETTQSKRGGGTVCSKDERIYKAVSKFIIDTVPCDAKSSSSDKASSSSLKPTTSKLTGLAQLIDNTKQTPHKHA